MAEGGHDPDALNVRILSDELSTVFDWYQLGIKLGVPDYKLKEIERSYPTEGCSRWRLEALSWWLRYTPNASWKSVVRALQQMGANTLAERMQQKYITKQSIHPIEEDSGAVAIARENQQNINSKFGVLLMNSRMKLKKKHINIKGFCLFLKGLFPPGDCIPKSSNIDEIFVAITHNRLWNYWNFSPLQKVVQEFLGDDKKMKSWIETYKKDLIAYKAMTKLVDYIRMVDSNSSSEDSFSEEQAPAKYDRRYYHKLSIKLEATFTSHTLEYLDDLWKEFADLYNLPPLVTLLDCVYKSSILIVWLIPARLAHHILRAAPGSVDIFRKHQITKVEFDGECIYRSESLLRMSLYPKCCRESPHYEGRGGSALELELHFACARNQLSNVKDLLTCASGLEAINTQPVEIIERGTRNVYEEIQIQIGTEWIEGDEVYDKWGGCGYCERWEVPVYKTERVCRGTESFIKCAIQHSAPIYVAAQCGNISIVKHLAEFRECDLNIINIDGNTPLHVACEKGHLGIVRFLVQQKYNFGHRNRCGKAPIHIACEVGHLNIVKLLLSNPKCDINAEDSDGGTPLHVACKKGHFDIVRCLVEKKCNFDHRNRRGKAPIHIACEVGQLDIVKLLLSNPNCDVNFKDSDGGTPLHVACNMCNLRIVRALLATGKADPTIRNDEGKSALEMTYDYTITREVAEYARATLQLKKKNPLGSYVQVFVVGSAAAGKTTLIEVLRREAAVILKYMKHLPKAVAPNVRTFRDAEPNTPGIVPHELKSKTFGAVVIHDLAGQCEHYSSHAAVVENSVLTSAPLFVIVINLCEENESIRRRLSYWLSFIMNHCKKATTPPHVTIVGSHEDEVKSKEVQKKLSTIREALPTESPLHFTEPPAVALDCRNVASKGLDKLRSTIKTSCLALREDQDVYFGCHALYGFLRQFEKPAFTVKDVLSKIQKENILLPQTVPGVIELLSALNDKGLLLLLKNTSDPAGSWVIFQKGKLISEVNGKLFAPEYKSTGVVSLSGIHNEFPQYDPNVLIGLLTHLEFCHKMDEYAKLALYAQMSSEHMSNRKEEYFLFPGLIKTERPADVWSVKNDKEKNDYCCGWTLCCTKSEELLETRFLHVLLLRLAFSFPLLPEEEAHAPIHDHCLPAIARHHDRYLPAITRQHDRYPAITRHHDHYPAITRHHDHYPAITRHHDHYPAITRRHDRYLPAITRHCKMWKNGIRWLTKHGGVEIIVEVLEENRKLVLMMNCGKEYKDSCAKLRSEVIVEILRAKKEFCETVSTEKSLMNCSQDLHEPSLFSIKELIPRVHNRMETHAVDIDGAQAMPIETLLGFEPYISVDYNIVRQVLSKGDTDTPVPTELLSELDENCAKYFHFQLHFRKYKEKQDLTFQTLRCEVFDKFSIFDEQFHKELVAGATRDPPTGDIPTMIELELVAGATGDLPTGDIPTMIELVRFRGIAKRINIPQEISIRFYPFGLLLLEDKTGARVSNIEHKHRGDVEHINMEIFREWINGKGMQPVTWGTLIKVLHDVRLTALAKDIAAVKLK